jgi:hypothetical protein
MHHSLSDRALLGVAALIVASTAQASTTATSTLADFHIEVTDLDPSDGVAPSLVLDAPSRSTVSVVESNTPTFWLQQGDSAFGAVSTSGELDGTGGSASFAGDPFGAGATLTASAMAGPSPDVGESVAYVEESPFGLGELVLGARTQVTFVGSVTFDWSAADVGAATHAAVDLSFWRIVGDGEEALAQDDLADGYLGNGQGPLAGTTSIPLELSFANASDASMVIGYQLAVRASATGHEEFPSPVGEPACAALLLVGVSTLLWTARLSGGSGACPSAPSRCRARRPR